MTQFSIGRLGPPYNNFFFFVEKEVVEGWPRFYQLCHIIMMTAYYYYDYVAL
jgi:hypothetical protein